MSTRSAAALPQLAQRASGGDAAALERLLRELRPLVVRTTRLVVGAGSGAAEDAAQEALVDMAYGIGGLNDPERVRAWAMRIAVRRAVRVARRERLRVRRADEVEVEDAPAPHSEPALASLKAAFDRLPPRARAVAVLRLYSGLSEEETAEVLGCSVGAVKAHLHKARRRLADTLREEGLAPTVREVNR